MNFAEFSRKFWPLYALLGVLLAAFIYRMFFK